MGVNAINFIQSYYKTWAACFFMKNWTNSDAIYVGLLGYLLFGEKYVKYFLNQSTFTRQ